jgi:(p)ppGpp synthase/HD superfamily hydrolase
MDSILVDNARQFAISSHLGQTDKLGAPYYDHPEAVARIVRERHADDPEIDLLEAVAWLHDVIEDCGGLKAAISLLDKGFPSYVVTLVLILTHLPDETNEKYWARVRNHRVARLVKLADIAHNTDPERLARLDEATRSRLMNKYSLALEALKI